jgi:hypothetical protein
VNEIPWAYLDEDSGQSWKVGFALTGDPSEEVLDIMLHHGGYDDDSIF